MRWAPNGPAFLFCPADRPERFEKAERAADVVILDLEDGVLPDNRAAARRALAQVVLDPARTIVRVNPAETQDQRHDLEALSDLPYRFVMLPKSESVAQCDSLSNFDVICLCETATGVLNATAMAGSQSVVGLMWGAEDLVASLGGRSSRDPKGEYRSFAVFARSLVLLAARSAGKAAIDAVHLDIPDISGLRDEARDAAASGFAATACIHPTQISVIRDAYMPSSADIAWASGVREAARGNGGVFTHEGRMIDAPLLCQAEAILRATVPDHLRSES